jgi:hypothetical protein
MEKNLELLVDAMTMKNHDHTTIEVYENGELVYSDTHNMGWAQVSY